jgi:hypothetical protein
MAMSLAVRAASDQQMVRDTVPREAKLAVFLRHGRDGRAIATTRLAAGLADVAGYFMSRCESSTRGLVSEAAIKTASRDA